MKRLARFLLPDTVVVRAVTVLLLALLVVNAVGYMTYRMGIDAIIGAARERELAERISSIAKAVNELPSAAERDRAAHALSTLTLEVHWAHTAPMIENPEPDAMCRSLAERLKTLLVRNSSALAVGYVPHSDRGLGATGALSRPEGAPVSELGDTSYNLQVSVRLDDNSWLWFLSYVPGTAPYISWSALLVPLYMCVAIILIAVLSLRWVTRPLRLFADAAGKFNLDVEAQKVPEFGPVELRTAARAMNSMLERIQLLVRERTAALAALSHDLRTPITRIQLRNELTEDDTLRGATEADLAEMNEMIQSTLEYLRVGAGNMPRRAIDVGAMLHTICDEQADIGHDVALNAPPNILVSGSPNIIKRALTNVIGNACKYADKVRVDLTTSPGYMQVTVRDEGPGIPEQDLERVFEPFYRVESSRSRTTGGTGLGLTIARKVIEGHSGSVTLTNRPAGGLEVVVSLPLCSVPNCAPLVK